MRRNKDLLSLLVIGFLSVGLWGCGEEEPDTVGEKLEEAAEEVGDAIDDTTDEMRDAAEELGDEIEDEVEKIDPPSDN